MEYITTKEASNLWSISERRIRKLIKDGRIKNAIKKGQTWQIPYNTIKPIDKRFKYNEDKIYVKLDKNYFHEIDNKRKKLESIRPLPRESLNSLREANILDFTYNSNAIEGNTLTLRETQIVLEGITVGGKTVKEHLEVINHKEALLFLEDLVKNKEEVNEWNICLIHKLVLKNINPMDAGSYRIQNVIVKGAKHKPIDFLRIPEKMEKLIENYNHWQEYHPIIRAGLLHGELVKIHPFIDGNGRTSRLLMNFEAMKNKYVPIIIKKEDRLKYYETLDYAHTTGDYTKFIKLLVELENDMLDKYLSILEIN